VCEGLEEQYRACLQRISRACLFRGDDTVRGLADWIRKEAQRALGEATDDELEQTYGDGEGPVFGPHGEDPALEGLGNILRNWKPE
jgi:hypothetical protein